MHSEMGYIRILPSNKVEFLVSHPFGATGINIFI
jgi:hypothetical protein